MGRQSDPWKYFELAARAATLKDDLRTHKIGAAGVRSDGVLVLASNGPVKTKRLIPGGHAEVRLCRKMDKHGTVYVVRVAPSGYGLARPCPTCQRALRSRRVTRVYYTITPNEYGVLDL